MPGLTHNDRSWSPERGSRHIRFVEQLGQGGFGAVYLADVIGQDGFVQRLAVKVLSPEMTADAQVAARQRDEARLLGRLVHDHIVKVFDLIEISGRPAVLMEYVEGVDASRLRRAGVLGARATFQVIAAAASALDAAWSSPGPVTGRPLRVVHRDIKPANLLVSRHGGVKVLDFGVARAEFDREGVTGSVQFGTARYMAPEQWLTGEAGHAVDVYALGVTLIELLTGETLPRAPLQPEAFEAHVEAAAAAAARAVPQPEHASAVGTLITAMLAYRPDARPSAATVQDAAMALADALPGESLARLAPRVVPALMDERRAWLAGRRLPGTASLSTLPPSLLPDPASTRSEARSTSAAPPLPPHLAGAPRATVQTPSARLRGLPRVDPGREDTTTEDSGLTLEIARPAPPARPASRSRRPLLLGLAGLLVAAAVGLLAWLDQPPAPSEPARSEPARSELAPSEPTAGEPPAAVGAPPPAPAKDPVHAQPEPASAADAPRQPAAARSAPAPKRSHPAAADPAPAEPKSAAPEPTPTVSPASDPVTPPMVDDAEAAKAEPAAAAPATASLPTGFSSEPLGARVWVDGVDHGTTPVRRLLLPPGRHTVRMTHGDARLDTTLRISALRPIDTATWVVGSQELVLSQ